MRQISEEERHSMEMAFYRRRRQGTGIQRALTAGWHPALLLYRNAEDKARSFPLIETPGG